MVEFEKVLYSPDLKMVLIFLVTKVFQKGTMFEWVNVFEILTWDAMSRNGQRQAWWPECERSPSPPGKLVAQLKSPIGESCYSDVFWTTPLCMI